MPLFSKNGKTLLFVHVPKTGGVALTKFFISNGFSVSWYKKGYSWLRRECTPQHRTRKEILVGLDREGIEIISSFSFVRSPIERLVSEYFFQRRSPLRIKRWLAHLDFNVWFDFVMMIQAVNPIFFDNHLVPQAEFVLEDTVIFKYEESKDIFMDFLNNLADGHSFLIEQKRVGRFNEGANKYPIQISKRTCEKIRAFYRQDFEKFYPEL